MTMKMGSEERQALEHGSGVSSGALFTTDDMEEVSAVIRRGR